jgi:hypothetical protein
MARRWQKVQELLFSKTAAAAVACLGAVIVLGCMNISLGGKHDEVCKPVFEECPPFEQVGKIPIRAGNDQVIYYAVAYTSPPNLEVEDPFGLCEVLEQKENCFKVHFHANVTSSPQYLAWKARGARMPSASVPAAGVDMSPPAEDLPPGAVLVSTPSPQH